MSPGKTTHAARTNRYDHSTSPEENSAPVQAADVYLAAPSNAVYPGTTTKLFDGGKIFPKNKNAGNYRVIIGMHHGNTWKAEPC